MQVHAGAHRSYPVPVDSELAEPIKRRDIVTSCLDQLLQDVSGMNLDGDEADDLHSLYLCQVGPHRLGELAQHGNLQEAQQQLTADIGLFIYSLTK